MIIGITGTIAAGKGTVVEILKERGFKHYSVRGFLNQELEKKGLEKNRDNQVNLANELRSQNSPSYIVEKLYEQASQEGENVIIESLRTPGEVNSLKDNEDFYLLAVDADSKLRYERAIKRASENDKISYDEFVEQEKREMTTEDPNKQNIAECMSLADYKIDNNGSLEELREKIDSIMKETDTHKPDSKISKENTGKRKDYIPWDDYFMGVALLSAKRSKDPNTQIGACIVNERNHIVGTGYNGFPIGCSDEIIPWKREGEYTDTKYPYVCHAELNAILNSTTKLYGCTLYVSLMPCNECAKAIIQSGIREIVYISDKYKDKDSFKAAPIMLKQSGVKMRQMTPDNNNLVIDFNNV